MSQKQKIIVLRFSAMGDVAMVASVLREFLQQNENAEVIMVSRSAFKPFFRSIERLTFHAIEPKSLHKGVKGLFKLFQELKAYNASFIADLHDNLRSRVISTFFRFSGANIERLDKGRAEKKALTRSKNKIFKPLKTTVERYADVFRNLGYTLNLSNQLVSNPHNLPLSIAKVFNQEGKKFLGISPFAQHIYKVYPYQKMEMVIKMLYKNDIQIFIFGGGKAEQEIANEWKTRYPNIINLIGDYTLNEELDIISNLNLMLSMDSSGMHMASLMGIPVISVWGPTHPYAGFLGYGQKLSNCIQIEHPNRPNSVYGNKPCLCGVENCMDLINPETIANKIEHELNG